MHAHLHTCMRRCSTYSTKMEHTHFLHHGLRSIARGHLGPLFSSFFFYIYFSILWSLLLSLGSTPLHSAGCCCCAVVFSLIIEHGNGQGPIKNISDAIITLAARKMNQIVSIGLTNGLGFNFISTIGLVASVCLIFYYFSPY